ncbi:MAG TPA: DUF692 domain-containing protein [Polyangiaceae bacterium]|nr:DUF692 domain-containing protein [Polyangiaceae bacterium]
MNRFGLPDLGIGVGLRTVHYATILEQRPDVGWFEIISENYMQTAGRPLEFLDAIAERYPIVMHGVSLSIGSTSPLDRGYLSELRALRDRVAARWVSDHLCFTGSASKNTHDLLPLPYSEATLRHVVDRVREVQDLLGAPLALENPSSYAQLSGGSMPEWEFLARLAEAADSAILLDVNNVYVSAYNHGFDPEQYLAAMPFDRIVQLHVAGHTQYDTHILDSHIGPVIDAVWQLLAQALERNPEIPVLLEWDAEIPSFEVVHREALRAAEYRGPIATCTPGGTRPGSAPARSPIGIGVSER